MKFLRKIKKGAIGVFVIVAVVVMTILLLGDSFTIASDKKEEGTFKFSWGKDVAGKDLDFGTFSMKSPDRPYLTEKSRQKTGYVEGTYYGNPQLDGVRMYLENWKPSISYDMKISKGAVIKTGEINVRHHGYSNYSNYSKTYYIVDDTGTPYNYQRLWKDFQEYADERCKGNGEFWKVYERNMAGSYLYSISQKREGGALAGANAIAKELGQYLEDFFKEVGAVEYSPDTGIDFNGMAVQNEAYVCVIRAGMSKVELDYTVKNDSENYWMEQYIPFLMFSVSNYEVKFKTPLNQPVVEGFVSTVKPVTDQNPAMENSVYKDESVRLGFSGDETISSKKLEYCLLSSDYTISEVEGLNQFKEVAEEEYIGLSGIGLSGDYRYLYVRTKLADDTSEYQEYRDSAIAKYKFNLHKEKVPGTITLELESGEEPDAVDAGDVVILNNSNGKATTFYTSDGTLPEFTLFMGDKSLRISDLEVAISQESSSVKFLGSRQDYNYLRVNGYWYRCSKSVKKYTGPITVGSQIRQQNRLLLRIRSVQNGYESGEIVSASMAYKLKQQVSAPVADIKTSEGSLAQLEMGGRINFSSDTVESEIFYTTNGSVPVVVLGTDSAGNTITQPGNEATKKYDTSTSVTITEEIASYGNNLTFTVKAVCYEGAYRKMEDSDVVKFIYKIGDQLVVESVSAIPATDAQNPTTVTKGDKIMLYSMTQGATIYYTMDGTEPTRKDDGTLEGKTKKYNASKGVTVPAQKKETLFIITAFSYADGYTVSEVTRIVYKYPDAVTPPYATPGSGVVNEYTGITLKSSTEGAVIYYELATGDNKLKNPSQNSKVFDSANPIVITGKTSIKAIAINNGISSTVSTFTYQVSDKLSAPTPSLPNGSVIASGTSLNLTADEGASIYYTTDGSNPSDNTNANFGSSLLLEGTPGSIITIRAYASKEGFSDSEMATYSYSFSSYGEGIFADKESGTVVKNNETVKLNTDVSNGVIYYTTDGSIPSTSSSQGNTVLIQGEAGSAVTVKAIVVIPGTTRTAAAAVFTYTIMDKLAAPGGNVPSSAIFTEEGQVVLSAPAGTIYYTTDGTQPTKGSSVYKDSITVNRDMTIRAIAISEETEASDVSTFVYTFARQVDMPYVSHESGELLLETEITLDCATEGATIYYTTNGTDPNLDDMDSLNTYTGPIKVSRVLTFKVMAVKAGMRESKVLTVGYTVREPVVEEEGTDDVQIQVENESGRLMSRRTFSGENQGPSLHDIVLKNPTYGVMVGTTFDVIPDDSKLNVSSTNASESGKAMLKQNLGEHYDFVSTFEIGLESEGEEIQPDGVIELGIPIDPEFENAVIYVVYVGDDGTIEVADTRRSGGMAYALVTHVSQYSIVAPKMQEEEKRNLVPIIIAGTVVAVIAGFATFAVVRRKKYYD